MIISHKYKFIFFAIPKTATHAIRFALRPHLAANDEEQVLLYVDKKKTLSIPQIAQIPHGHIKATQLIPFINPTIWNSYFKFCFVRNPYERFISLTFFFFRNSPLIKTHTNTCLQNCINNNTLLNERILFHQQYEFIFNKNEQCLVDYVGRFENLQKEYDYICNQIGISTQKLNLINNTIHKPYYEYYDEPLKQAVTKYYKKDIELFNYSF